MLVKDVQRSTRIQLLIMQEADMSRYGAVLNDGFACTMLSFASCSAYMGLTFALQLLHSVVEAVQKYSKYQYLNPFSIRRPYIGFRLPFA